MQYRTIQGTDLSVSTLGFGNFTFGVNWWRDSTDEESAEIHNYAFDQGVNFFDTAPAYGNGLAEARMKPVIAYAGRDNLVISTKFGYDLGVDPGEEGSHRERKQNFDPDFIRLDCENSLKNMGIDCIDLYQSHNIKLPQMTDELFEVLNALKDEGKIKAWGLALGPAIGWREEGHEGFIKHDAAVIQNVFNVYEQDLGLELCEIAAQRGRGGVISRVPTNSGILDEEFADVNHKFPPNDHRKFRDRAWLVYGLQKNEVLRPFAEEVGLSLRQFAFAWLASQPGMVSIEPNILWKKDIDDFASAADAPALPADMLARVRELYLNNFGLGEEAHPCDHKSSTDASGAVKSMYVKPELMNV